MLGRTVAIFGLTGHDDEGHEHTLSGLYVVEEFCPYEPSNYCWSDCFLLVRADEARDSRENIAWPSFSVDADDLWAQVEPQDYGNRLAEMRWMELAMEDADYLASLAER